MNAEFDPYYTWMGIPKEEQPADQYRLLGVRTFEDNPEVIENAADQRMAYIRTFQNGPRAAVSQQILNELSAARICLLSPLQKDEYDRRLRAELARQSASRVVRGAEPPSASTPVESGGASAPASGRPPAIRRRKRLGSNPMFAAGVTIAALTLAVAGTAWSLLSHEQIVAQSESPARIADAAAPAATDATPPNPASRSTAPNDLPVKVSAIANAPLSQVDAITPVNAAPAPSSPPVSGEVKTASMNSETKSSQSSAAPSANAASVDALGDGGPAANQMKLSSPPALASVLEESNEESKTAAPHEPSRRPEPSSADIASAVDEVRQVLKSDLEEARLPQQKLALAKRMLGLGRETKADAARFVLFKEAAMLAAEGADVLLAFSIIGELTQDFDSDPVRHRVDALEAALALVRTVDDRKQLADAALKEANAAIRAGLYETAKQAARVATAAASRAGDATLRLKTRSLSKEVDVVKRKADFAQQAAQRLEIEPENPKANLAWGEFLCFQRQNWEEGVPYLAKGDDAALKAAAEKDLAGPADAEQQGAAADAWWSLAQAANDDEKSALLSRARHWYRLAAAKAGGLTKARFNKRIEDIESEISQDALVAGDRTVPLIPLFDASRVVRGEWTLQNGALVCATQNFRPRLTFPYHPPQEYDFKVVFSQPQVRNGVSLILSKHNRSFSWVAGGAAGAFHFTVGRLAGRNPSEVRVPGAHRPGVRHTALVQVRNGGVKAFFDGRPIAGFATDYTQLDNDSWHEVPDEKALGVGCDDPTVFHLIEVKEITGVGERAASQNAALPTSQSRSEPLAPTTDQRRRNEEVKTTAPAAKTGVNPMAKATAMAQRQFDSALRFTGNHHVKLLNTTASVDISKPITIEAWVRITAEGNFLLFGDYCWGKPHPDDPEPGAAGAAGWGVRLISAPDKHELCIQVAFGTGSAGHSAARIDAPGDSWHHVALCCNDEGAFVYWDGALTKRHPRIHGRVRKSFANLYLGMTPYTWDRFRFDGDIGAFRVSSSTRYAGSFTPPTSFEKEKDTVVLLDFSRGEGNTIPDLSGNEHHGEIVGATWIRD